MAATSHQVRKIVRQFVRALETEIHVERVILYGSYARRQAGEWSDIDVAVLSPDFAGMSEGERVQLLARRMTRADARLVPLPYTPAQFDEAEPYAFAAEIRRTGRVIYDARKEAERVRSQLPAVPVPVSMPKSRGRRARGKIQLRSRGKGPG